MHWHEDDKILSTALNFFFPESHLIAFLKPSSVIYFKFILSHSRVIVILYSDEKFKNLEKKRKEQNNFGTSIGNHIISLSMKWNRRIRGLTMFVFNFDVESRAKC